MKNKKNTCSRAAKWEPKLYNYADDICTAEEKQAVEEHLALCPACRETLADIRWMLSAVRAGAQETVSVADAVMERIHTGDTVGENLLRTNSAVRMRRFASAAGGLAAAVVLLAGAVWLAPTLSRVSAGNAGTKNADNTALTAAQGQKYTDNDSGTAERSVYESSDLLSGVQYTLKMPEAAEENGNGEDAAGKNEIIVVEEPEMPAPANDFAEEYEDAAYEEAACENEIEIPAEEAVKSVKGAPDYAVMIGVSRDAERDAVREVLEQCTAGEDVIMTEYRNGWLISRSAYNAVYDALSAYGWIVEMATAACDAGETADDFLYVYIE